MVLLIDLDEVFADFVGGALRLFGKNREWLERECQPNEGDLTHCLKMTQAGFNREIDLHPHFWLGLKPLPWASELRALLRFHVKCPWYIATSPRFFMRSYYDKKVWIQRFFGSGIGDFDRFFVTNYKFMLAKKDTVLIDDCANNLRQFSDHGGDTIMFPSFLNCMHEQRNNPLDHVKEQLCLRKML